MIYVRWISNERRMIAIRLHTRLDWINNILIKSSSTPHTHLQRFNTSRHRSRAFIIPADVRCVIWLLLLWLSLA